MFETECFKIRLLSIDDRLDQKPWDAISKGNVVYQVTNNHSFSKLNPVIIVADPFLFVHKDELYLFYEEKRLHDPGVLKMTKTSDLLYWSNPVTVLQEPFHLSYPCVFEDNGNIYMIPETGAVGEVRLYKATDKSLTKFELHSVLLRSSSEEMHIDDDFSDSSIYKQNGIYYLMTTQKLDGVNTLRLFVSEKLDGNFEEHPESPISRSQEYGRNAGCMLPFKGELYRFAQDCVKRYGDNISIFRVKELTPARYSEKLEKANVLSNSKDFYKYGGHQINYVSFHGKTIIATDAKEYRRYLDYVVHRIKSIF